MASFERDHRLILVCKLSIRYVIAKLTYLALRKPPLFELVCVDMWILILAFLQVRVDD